MESGYCQGEKFTLHPNLLITCLANVQIFQAIQ